MCIRLRGAKRKRETGYPKDNTHNDIVHTYSNIGLVYQACEERTYHILRCNSHTISSKKTEVRHKQTAKKTSKESYRSKPEDTLTTENRPVALCNQQ